MNLTIDVGGHLLLKMFVKRIVDDYGDRYAVVFLFEEHSGIPGDEIVIDWLNYEDAERICPSATK
jgi:hypothetical protein